MRSPGIAPALFGILLSIPVSTWWFARLSLETPLPGPPLIPLSLQVLTMYIGLQATCIALVAPVWITGSHSRSDRTSDAAGGLVDIISFLLPTLPLLVMLGMATAVSFALIATSQLIVLILGFAIALFARRTMTHVINPESRRLLATSIGVLGAAGVWALHTAGLRWLLA